MRNAECFFYFHHNLHSLLINTTTHKHSSEEIHSKDKKLTHVVSQHNIKFPQDLYK